jgi:hypothetical protein
MGVGVVPTLGFHQVQSWKAMPLMCGKFVYVYHFLPPYGGVGDMRVPHLS